MGTVLIATIDAIVDGLGNAIGWVLITILGGGLWIVRQIISNKRSINDLIDETEIDDDPTRLESHESRMERQQEHIAELKSYFIGDDNDPNNPGLLSEIHDIKQSLNDRDDDEK